MIDAIQGVSYVKDPTPGTRVTSNTTRTLNSCAKSRVSELEETEDYGSCSSTEMSPQPSHSSSINTPSIEKDIKKSLTLTFSDDDDDDLGVFV